MKEEIIKFLVEFKITKTHLVDRLIVSSFIDRNKISVKNNLLIKGYLITSSSTKEHALFLTLKKRLEKTNPNFTLEDLISIFEFVISPKEKVVTGAIYTPEFIREYIVANTLHPETNIRVADLACGCGGFLLTVARKIKIITGKNYSKIISDNIWGLDITQFSIDRTKIVLSLLALESDEDFNPDFNLFCGNALDFDWRKNSNINGFDLIVGNPPYICSRNIEPESKSLLDKWEVAKSGHPDLYIPFFQIAIENLKNKGRLGLITVNTFFKSVNGRALREYFSKIKIAFKIIDFKDEQVFKKRNTYTCICFFEKITSNHIDYVALPSSNLIKLSDIKFIKNEYALFNNKSGWNLVSNNTLKSVLKKIESLELKIFECFSFSTGVTTLKNDVYIFKPSRQDRQYYYFNKNSIEYPIEKHICRSILNSNKIKTEDDIIALKNKIIFPYQWNKQEKKYDILEDRQFLNKAPYAYAYLHTCIESLSLRDKGKKKYDAWFAFGRSQGLNIKGYKLFLPHITNNPRFVISADEALLFHNGEAIISDNEVQLKILKKILESSLFWFYIQKTSKPYSSGYLSLSKNYLKEFSLPTFTKQEESFMVSSNDKKKILELLLKKYNLSKGEIVN